MLSIDIQWQRGEFELAVKLDLPAGEVVLLSGPSGSGKTTLLRLIAGLEQPNRGKIQWNNQIWVDVSQHSELPTQQRNMCVVFQAYALFPHWTVADNLAFAQKEIPDTALLEELIAACDLSSLLAHYPSQLSGGQQQRVALARSLLQKSDVLLMDEPFAAQDWAGRQRLITYLQAYQQRYKTLLIISSHDSRGLHQWADRHIQMSDGHLRMSGPSANAEEEVIYLGTQQWAGRTFARLLRNGQEIWWPDPPEAWGTLHEGATVKIKT